MSGKRPQSTKAPKSKKIQKPRQKSAPPLTETVEEEDGDCHRKLDLKVNVPDVPEETPNPTSRDMVNEVTGVPPEIPKQAWGTGERTLFAPEDAIQNDDRDSDTDDPEDNDADNPEGSLQAKGAAKVLQKRSAKSGKDKKKKKNKNKGKQKQQQQLSLRQQQQQQEKQKQVQKEENELHSSGLEK